MRQNFISICGAILVGAGAASADEALGAHVAVELNALQTVEDSCQISFLVQNGHEADIAQAVYEAVLFDTEGAVERLTLFDFGALPSARPRVRQFVVPGLECAQLGRILFNGAQTCKGEADESTLPDGACLTDLELDSRTDVELIG